METLIGNAIVGQSGGPTAAINATLAGVIEGAISSSEIKTLFGAVNGIEGMLSGNICNLTERFSGNSDIEVLKKTPAAALGSCRKKLPNPDGSAESESVYRRLFDFFEKNDIRYFFYIGGNDSMDTVAKVSAYAEKNKYAIRVMGVPKTIDNDVVGTDHTPGFGSAAKYIAVSMSEILRDCAVYTVKAVTVVEIMGRDAGWLTAASALTRKSGIEPDLIYLPEKPFDFESFYLELEKAFERHPNVVVAVSEGIRTADGRYVGESAQTGAADVFGHKYLAGTAAVVADAVKARFGCKTRSVELNILQRCASHVASKADIDESICVGSAAVETAISGISGKMMTLSRAEGEGYHIVPHYENIEKIANKVKAVPSEFITENGAGITDECVEYLLPLIEGECYPEYSNGLPIYLDLREL